MEVVQHDINVSMRTILIDWLVEVVQVGCGNILASCAPLLGMQSSTQD